MTVDKQNYHRASNAVVFGGLITYIAGLLLLISFSSPYWIESYQETFNDFKHMGLWEYHFSQFRYPYYQFDKQFEWLIPVWLMIVRAFVTLALLLSIFAQVIIVTILIRWPLGFVLNYEWILSSVAFLCNAATGILLFLAVSVFGGQCWRRDWLMYPNYNHLSWAYALAVISFMLHSLGAFLLYLDARAGYRFRKKSDNLVMQMQTNPQSHHGSQRSGYV